MHKGLSAAEVKERSSRGETYALRLDMARALELVRGRLSDELSFIELDDEGRPRRVPAHPERWGDAVIVRKDVPASYHLAVVVDDARQGVTHVTRGADLFAATDLHRLLQVLLDLPAPIYRHHRLIVDTGERKLSKSAGDTSLRRLREAGVSPEKIRSMVGLASAP